MPRRHRGVKIEDCVAKDAFSVDEVVGFLDTHPAGIVRGVEPNEKNEGIPSKKVEVTEKSFLGRPLLNGSVIVKVIKKPGFARYAHTASGGIAVPIMHPAYMSRLPESERPDLAEELIKIREKYPQFTDELKLTCAGLKIVNRRSDGRELRMVVAGELGAEVDVMRGHFGLTDSLMPSRTNVTISHGMRNLEMVNVLRNDVYRAKIPPLLHFGELAIMSYDEPEQSRQAGPEAV